MIGEWVALPVLRVGRRERAVVDPLRPSRSCTRRPSACSQHCDAVLRLPGESSGADQDVAIAESRGLPVYHRIEDVQLPTLAASLTGRHPSGPAAAGTEDRPRSTAAAQASTAPAAT